ncbi:MULTISPECIES: tripartite tricarboxylate transporter TctB family protein [Glutamicibacter]|uniref:Citrate transport protein TctB n=1 Tax=Glutamicibacter arilaitensis (strain DSM 16368 / CIP 108037 / IAM 15318 / JCM 13566 / NCIMB 14258 / Re117) TaxID=861360 RepID=A0ABP1U1J0_GLUAR|nr:MULTISPECIES: tripartite tricarboxylate transporter TctB family protein [Glutamicibacter]CBT75259.1 putative citrate transport protein TctB [Glutamicibacter arilaitensis Re117]
MSEVSTAKMKRVELLFAAFLLIVGIIVFVDASQLHVTYSQADVVGPKALPYVVSGILVLSAIALAITVLRGNLATGEEGEDVDLRQPSDWKVLIPLIGIFMLNLLIVNWVGWVISGTIMFFGTATCLGARRWVLTLVISLALAFGSFYGFYLGLGIKLPAGILSGVL